MTYQVTQTGAQLQSALDRSLLRAWVNFNGSGTVAINASYNVSSITDNGTGDYTVNFTSALSDANYCCAGITWDGTNNGRIVCRRGTVSTTAINIGVFTFTYGLSDTNWINLVVFR